MSAIKFPRVDSNSESLILYEASLNPITCSSDLILFLYGVIIFSISTLSIVSAIEIFSLIETFTIL